MIPNTAVQKRITSKFLRLAMGPGAEAGFLEMRLTTNLSRRNKKTRKKISPSRMPRVPIRMRVSASNGLKEMTELLSDI